MMKSSTINLLGIIVIIQILLFSEKLPAQVFDHLSNWDTVVLLKRHNDNKLRFYLIKDVSKHKFKAEDIQDAEKIQKNKPCIIATKFDTNMNAVDSKLISITDQEAENFLKIMRALSRKVEFPLIPKNLPKLPEEK